MKDNPNLSLLSLLSKQSPENEIMKSFNLDELLIKKESGTITQYNATPIPSSASDPKRNSIMSDDKGDIAKEIEALLTDLVKIFDPNEPFHSPIDDNQKQKEKESSKETIEDPLDFVQSIESNFRFEYQKSKDDNIAPLKSYAMRNKIVYNVYEFTQKKVLFINMNRQDIKVTSMIAFDDIIFGGFSNGALKLFSCEIETEVRVFSIQEETGAVVALDCTDDANYVIAAYRSGYVILWNITVPKPIKVVDDLILLQQNVKNKAVIAIKFINHSHKNSYCFICSDESGKLRKITITEGVFRTSVQIDLLIAGDNPFFSLKVMRFTEEEQKKYPQVKGIETAVVVLGNVEGVKVLFISEEKGKSSQITLFTSEHGLNNQIQDASFGIGNISPYAAKGNKTLQAEQIILAISIDKCIFLYAVPVNDKVISGIMPVGKYTHNNSIIRLGFISFSLLFFFTRAKAANIINTQEIEALETEINNTTKLNRLLTEKNQKFSKRMNSTLIPGIEKTSILIDLKKVLIRKHFNNYISAYPKKLFILTKSTFYSGTLITWEQYLKAEIALSKWEEALCLGIDIYCGKISTFADIPDQEALRKKTVGTFLRDKLDQFLKIQFEEVNLMESVFRAKVEEKKAAKAKEEEANEKLAEEKDKRTQQEKEKEKKEKRKKEREEQDDEAKANDEAINERIDNLIKYSIEFCFEIEAFDYLMQTLRTKYFNQLLPSFYEKLEQFVLSNKLSETKLESQTIEAIVNPYLEKKDFSGFSSVIKYLDKDTICNDARLQKICEEHKIISATIYISSNKEDYFLPLTQIYDKFRDANEIDWGVFKKYSNECTQLSMNTLEESKQYTGYKLLWYSDLCIKGKTYPKMNSIPIEKHKEVVRKTYCYLLSTNVLDSLIDFDSFCFFKIISQFFTNERVYEMIASMSQTTYDQIKHVYYYDTDISSTNKMGVIDMISKRCKKKSNFYITQDLNEFLVTISPILSLDKSIILTAIKSILSYYQNMKSLTEAEMIIDRFNSHLQLSMHNSPHVKDLSQRINRVLDSIRNLTEQEINEVLKESTLSPFLWVKIHLLKRKKEYLHCVETYLNLCIKEQQKEVFEFILDTFEELKEKDYGSFVSFKDGILFYFEKLADISFEEVAKLTHDWYDHKKDVIVSKLVNRPILQLKYLETVIDTKYKEIEHKSHLSIGKDMEKQLILQIKLLIKLDKKDQILKNLEERPFYPLKKCLKLCLANNVNDASIFIYQQLGSFMEALILSCQELKEIYLDIQKYCSKRTVQDTQLIIIIEDLRRNISQSESICNNYTKSTVDLNDPGQDKNNKDKEANKDIDDLWLYFLTELYNFLNKLGYDDTSKPLQAVRVTLSVEIENVLKTMCSFIPINKILANVEKNCKFAEYREFKCLLTKMLTSFFNMQDVLMSAKMLICHSIRYNMNAFKKLNIKAGCFRFDRCTDCKRMFDRDGEENILIFKCKHVFHTACAVQDKKDFRCKTCIQNETVEEDKMLLIKRKYSLMGAGIQENCQTEKSNHRIRQGDKKEKKLLNRMSDLDDMYLSYLSMSK